jgi:hypothetical protein
VKARFRPDLKTYSQGFQNYKNYQVVQRKTYSKAARDEAGEIDSNNNGANPKNKEFVETDKGNVHSDAKRQILVLTPNGECLCRF